MEGPKMISMTISFLMGIGQPSTALNLLGCLTKKRYAVIKCDGVIPKPTNISKTYFSLIGSHSIDPYDVSRKDISFYDCFISHFESVYYGLLPISKYFNFFVLFFSGLSFFTFC